MGDMASYYKYRSLKDFRRILDILINERLYAASFADLNDPMEGCYRNYKIPDKERVKQILDERSRTKICSLSKRHNIGSMWTHYADGNKGCCIELEVTSTSWEGHDVIYRSKLPNITSVQNILTVKGNDWSYEDEFRFIRTLKDKEQKPYLEISVKRVLFGYLVSKKDYKLYKTLIEGINKVKKKKGTIKVDKMKKEDLDRGYV